MGSEKISVKDPMMQEVMASIQQDLPATDDSHKIAGQLKLFSLCAACVAVIAISLAMAGRLTDMQILISIGSAILFFCIVILAMVMWQSAKRVNSLSAERIVKTSEETKKALRSLEETQNLSRTLAFQVKARVEQKEQLSAMLTHDLRNPISAVMAHIQLIMNSDNADEHTKTRAKNAYKSCQHLLEMVNQILDVMRMGDNKMPLKMSRNDIVPLIARLAEEYKADAETNRLTIKLATASDKVEVNVDLAILERVIENLLTNAIKHTPEGGSVTLGVGQNGSSVLVWVEDTGEGIPPEYRNMIFQKYGQVEAKKMGKKFDTGLGLLFCRMAIDLQGGKIYLDENTTAGSKFVIELPQ